MGREFVILRSFTKKTQKTPRAEIELALSRWSEIFEKEDHPLRCNEEEAYGRPGVAP